MTEAAAPTRGPGPAAPSEDQPEKAKSSEATAKKQAEMDANKAKRKPRGVVTQTTDNALAGAGVLAKEKAARRAKAAKKG